MIFKSYSKFALLTLLLFFVVEISHADNSTWTGVERIVAVGDIHGDYNQFVKTLRAANIINEQNQWTGNKTHLVQTGDVLDRGPDSRKVMDLLMSLEQQALKTGGRVHALIGNHEAMILYRDLRYVHPDEYASFGGKEAYLEALSPEGKYGQWIASHNSVIKINDVLFLHGGIGPHFATAPSEVINQRIRQELSNPVNPRQSLSMNPQGTLWYRGLVYDNKAEVDDLLKTVFKTHDINRIVVGHTVSKEGIKLRANGRVIMIDIGMSEYYGGTAGCLIIENGNYYAVYPDSKQEIINTSIL